MKLTIAAFVFVLAMAVTAPAFGEAVEELLKDVTGIALIYEIDDAMPLNQRTRLQTAVEQQAKKAGLNVVHAGTRDEYVAWLKKEGATKPELAAIPSAHLTCTIVPSGSDYVFSTQLAMYRLGYCETPSGTIALTLTTTGRQFRAAAGPVLLFESRRVTGLNSDMEKISDHAVKQFDQFINEWLKTRPK